MVLGVLSSPFQALFSRITGNPQGAQAQGVMGNQMLARGALNLLMGDQFQGALQISAYLAPNQLPPVLMKIAQGDSVIGSLLSPMRPKAAESLPQQMNGYVDQRGSMMEDRPVGPRKMAPGNDGPLNPNAPISIKSPDEIKATEKANKKAGDAMDVKGGELTTQVQGKVQAERARTEKSKYEFSEKQKEAEPEMKKKADEKVEKSNEKHREKAQEIGQEMAKVAADPKLAKNPEKQQKKLNELQKKLDGELKCIRPPFSLAGVTRQVDDIMNDKSLSAKEKSKQIDQIRKDYGLPKRGDNSMKKVITDPLADKYKESAKRLDGMKGEIEKAGKERLEAVEKQYGKGSPEAKAAKETVKADIKAAKEVQKKEHTEVKGKADQLKSLFPSPWQKFLQVMGKILAGIGSVLKFIPGIGTAIGTGLGLVGGGMQIAGGDKVGGALAMGGALIPVGGAGALMGGVAKGATAVASSASKMGGTIGTGVAKSATFIGTKAADAAAKAAPAAAPVAGSVQAGAVQAAEQGNKELAKFATKEAGKDVAKSEAKGYVKGHAVDYATTQYNNMKTPSNEAPLAVDTANPAYAFMSAMNRK